MDKNIKKLRLKKKIGDCYELEIGDYYKKQGYEVYYRGIKLGLKDKGIDLEAWNDQEFILIQCKNHKAKISKDIILKFLNDCAYFERQFGQKIGRRKIVRVFASNSLPDDYAAEFLKLNSQKVSFLRFKANNRKMWYKGTNNATKDFDPERAPSYVLDTPDNILDELESVFTKFNTTRYFINEPYITFELDKDSFSLNVLIDNSKVEILAITAVFNHFGLDFIVQTAGKNILVFNAFSIDKELKFNMYFFKNFINKKKAKKNREVENIEIEYNESFDLKINGQEYKNCSCSIILEKNLSRELLDFYEMFSELDISSLQRYKDLKIYLNKAGVAIDELVLFDIKNCDEVDKLNLNFIDNRAFYIDENKRLVANHFYLTPLKNISFECNVKGKTMVFDKNEGVMKLPKSIVLGV